MVADQTTYDLSNLYAMLADGNQIEITTVPGEFTNFLEVTTNGTADWIENADQTPPAAVFCVPWGTALPDIAGIAACHPD